MRVENVYEYLIQDQKVIITKYIGEEDTVLDIPAQIEDFPVAAIGEGAFMENGALIEKIVLPNSMRRLEHTAFSGCMSLSELVLNEGLEFLGAEFLTITSVSELFIPASVSEIEEPYMLSEVLLKISPDSPYYTGDGYGLYKQNPKTLVSVNTGDDRTCYRVENGTRIIGENAFSGQSFLEDIVLNDQVQVIREGAFMLCDQLQQIYLPDGLEEIQKDAFAKCPALEHIKLPVSLRKLSERALTGTYDWDYKKPGLYDVTVDPKNPVFFTDESGLYERLTDDSQKLVKYLGKDKTVTIKPQVQVIGAAAFRRSGILQVNLHKDVREIHKDAFLECRLKRVWMEKDQVMLHIPEEPFALGDEAISFFDHPMEGHLYGYDRYDRLLDDWKLCSEKIKMMCSRLTYPVEVSERQRELWITYIKIHLEEVITIIADGEDLASLKELIRSELFTIENIEAAIDICNKRGKSTLVGVLMEHKNNCLGNVTFDFSI